jgi:hypothetical protein
LFILLLGFLASTNCDIKLICGQYTSFNNQIGVPEIKTSTDASFSDRPCFFLSVTSVMVQYEEFGCECIGPDSDTGSCYVARVAPESLAPKLWMGRVPKVYSNFRVFEPRTRRDRPPKSDLRLGWSKFHQAGYSQRSFAQLTSVLDHTKSAKDMTKLVYTNDFTSLATNLSRTAEAKQLRQHSLPLFVHRGKQI